MAKKNSKAAVRATSKRRLLLFFTVVVMMFVIIAAKIGYIQIVKADEYSDMALEQQTRDIPITAKRGNIYDANMKALAINQSMYTIWVRPGEVEEAERKEKGYTKDMAEELSEIIPDMTEEEIYESITRDKTVVKLIKYADDETTQKVREAYLDKETPVTGIQIAETVRRYYPMGAFASHLIGSTNDDNNGMSGIELYYDQYLNGTEGRWIKSSDASGRNLTNGIEKYYPAENGLSVVLTIDEVIQHYTEKAVEQVYADTRAESVMALTMNPKTGEILSMAAYPDYDLNDPRTPLLASEQAKLENMTDEEKVEYWNEMWRNPLINDTYEPGSPFKLLTTAMALEENLTSVNDGFYCQPIQLYDRILKCWSSASHQAETLAQGVANSCNPVFVTLSQRLGIETFYEYLEAYGFMDQTGIDYPGEAESIIQSKKNAGPVGLATMSYGQGIACTPVQLMMSLCAAGNEGVMMKPHLVSKLVDSDGNTVETFEPEVVRQVISKQTATEICQMMEGVVNGGTGKSAYIPGYRIGGKTGTAQKVENGRYTDYTFSSFFAMAPMDDPQFAVLFIVDSPKGVHYGSQTAGPGVYAILSDALKYLKIEPVYTETELNTSVNKMITVPDFTGYTYEKAAEILKRVGLTAIACPSGEAGFTIVDQYPKGGEKLAEGNAVCLYKE
ncbi:MAG: PASTA domain-containing protein [Firmicutes bacterium]|nr:PASTA domain-containing protein [Bacillota bacterium]